MDWNAKDYPKAKYTYDPQFYLTTGLEAANKAADTMKQAAINLGMVTDISQNKEKMQRNYYNHYSFNITIFSTSIYDRIIKTMKENLKAYSDYFDGYQLYFNIEPDINNNIYCQFLYEIGIVVDYDTITDDEATKMYDLIREFYESDVAVPYLQSVPFCEYPTD